MKKHLISVLTAVLCTAALSSTVVSAEAQTSGQAESKEAESILKGLSFGSSSGQAESLLGQPSARYTDQDGNLVLSYMASVVNGVANSTIEYGFSGDRLVFVRCLHADPAGEPAVAIDNYRTFSESLTGFLGDPVYNRFSLICDFSGSEVTADETEASLESGDSIYSGFWQNDTVSAEMCMEKTSDASILITVGLDASEDRKTCSEEDDAAAEDETTTVDETEGSDAAGSAVDTDGSDAAGPAVDTDGSDAAGSAVDTDDSDKGSAADDGSSGDAVQSASGDFKGFSWGDSVDDVTAYEGKPNGSDAKDPHEYIYYLNRSVSGKSSSLAYYFRKDRLIKTVYLIQDTKGNTAALSADYDDILDTIAAKYGNPVSSGTSWDTDEHRSAFEGAKENQALEQGFLTYETFWYTNRSVLSVSLGRSSRTGLVTLSVSFQDADVFFGQTEITEEIYSDTVYPDGF